MTRILLEISQQPFVCDHCGDTFTSLSTKGHHINKKNKELTYCQECALELMQPDFDDLATEIKIMAKEGMGARDIQNEIRESFGIKVSKHAVTRYAGRIKGISDNLRTQIKVDYGNGQTIESIAYVYRLKKRLIRRVLIEKGVKI